MTMMTHSENKVKVVPELNLDAVEVVLNSKICEPPCELCMMDSSKRNMEITLAGQ